jgi:hypothetical protein
LHILFINRIKCEKNYLNNTPIFYRLQEEQNCHIKRKHLLSLTLGAFFWARYARPKKPGFPGLRYRSGPAYGVAASHPSNPLRAHQRQPTELPNSNSVGA